MGYDVQFIQVPAPPNTSFPIKENETSRLLAQAVAFDDLKSVTESLLQLEGCRPGPDDSVDYMGRGLSYARFVLRNDAIHVENNCSAHDLVEIYGHLRKAHRALLIFDLQSKQLHNAASFTEWWLRPL